ncbi:NAD(P)-dependent alcohol dehydrogenase [Paenibacillus glycanilyticus]|uniref:NADPH:quinone reductase n=1 Tax=Paenibacillus glycanilyticus TaxID=126569 RepID=A0ABQ6GH38_9BACL|nr:NAD(P)-dependent alcohol dehydrogenase [Paenibacillus glycanilyticus]GLX70264.1 NADPH:quinone reductase [Paenibacillus glycanilyticus]
MEARKMKALIYEAYGTPEVMQITEVDVPKPKDHEVLIEVHAASVNSWDWDLLRGKPYITRIGGFRTPRFPILGADVAGVVIATGSAATRFQPGDEVFGDLSGCSWGGFAEYVCAHEKALTLKPGKTNFEQAAAIPQAAVLALQGLRNNGNLQHGHKVLLNGAGGGVGTFALQYAKLFGAEVTAVDDASKLEMLRILGADHVLDYRQEDFTARGRQYDLILDVVGTRSVFKIKRALKKGGTYVMIGGTMPRLVQTLLAAPVIRRLERKRMTILVHKPNHEDQQVWKELVEAGHVAPVIDRLYGLDDAAEAIRYFGEGKFKGKIVVRIKS